MQIEDFLENSARRWSGKTALVAGGRRLTYGELDVQCNRLAQALAAEGVGRGDRVVIYLDNTVEAVVAIFAALKAEAVFVVINPTTKADKLLYLVNNCGAAAMITHTSKLEAARESLREPSLKAVFVDGAVEAWRPSAVKPARPLGEILQDERPVGPLPKRGIDIDLAALIYTSGSTGRSKGVMLTHLNIVSAANSITTYLENKPDDIILNVLPLSFDYGLYQVLMAFKIGGTVVLERSFTYPAVSLQRIAQEKVTGFPIVPTIAAILLQMDLSKWDLSSLRYITNTAAALPSDHIAKLRRLFPRVRLYSMYGLTECKRVSYLPPEQIHLRPGSVGRGMPNTEVSIVDAQGDPVGPGVVGELVVRGSNVMKGYWRRPEETAKVLKPGRFPGETVLYSGDLFRADEEGYLYFVGRKDDIIKTRGEKVSPKEVEEILYSLPGVIEAAVVGTPDPVLGSSIKAILVTQKGVRLTEKDVLRHCASRMEDFMVPKSVEFRDQLPKTSNGKIAKQQLVENLQLTSPRRKSGPSSPITDRVPASAGMTAQEIDAQPER